MNAQGDGVQITGLTELVAKIDTDVGALFNPMTGPLDTTRIEQVRLGVWLNTTEVSCKSAVQFSDNGLTWDTAVAVGSSFSASLGWTVPTDYTSLFGLTGPKLYCRFGVLAKTVTVGGTGDFAGGGQARLSVEVRPSSGRSVSAERVRVNTNGTTTAIFHPLTGALQTSELGEVRATVRLESTSGFDGSGNSLIQLQPAYQVSDTPDDWSDWATAVAFGTNVTTQGTTFGTTFETLTTVKRYIRFGVLAKNDSDSSAIEACLAGLRVDMRN